MLLDGSALVVPKHKNYRQLKFLKQKKSRHQLNYYWSEKGNVAAGPKSSDY